MPASLRRLDRADQRVRKVLRELGDELRERRLSLGVSQAHVAAGARISRPTYSRIENARLKSLSLDVATRVAAVLGLDLVIRYYPGPDPLRDTGQRRRLMPVLESAAAPLSSRTEVPLPQRPDGIPEQRAWDAEITGHGARTVIELEMRLRDAQALERRIALKRRDDPSAGFLLLIVDTAHNRRVLREHPDLFPTLPRLARKAVLDELRAGRHPPSALVLI